MTWTDGEHLSGLYGALYQELGQRAPTFTNDSLAVRGYELARAFGERVIELRALDVVASPSTLVAAMLEHATLEEPSGAITLFAVTMLLSPRLLVWLRDLAATPLTPGQEVVVATGQSFLVTSMHESGSILASQPPLENEQFSLIAQSLLEMLVAAGWDEHLGPRT